MIFYDDSKFLKEYLINVGYTISFTSKPIRSIKLNDKYEYIIFEHVHNDNLECNTLPWLELQKNENDNFETHRYSN